MWLTTQEELQITQTFINNLHLFNLELINKLLSFTWMLISWNIWSVKAHVNIPGVPLGLELIFNLLCYNSMRWCTFVFRWATLVVKQSQLPWIIVAIILLYQIRIFSCMLPTKLAHGVLWKFLLSAVSETFLINKTVTTKSIYIETWKIKIIFVMWLLRNLSSAC